MARSPILSPATLQLIVSDMPVRGSRPLIVIGFVACFPKQCIPSSDWFVWLGLFVSAAGVWWIVGLINAALDRVFASMARNRQEAHDSAAGIAKRAFAPELPGILKDASDEIAAGHTSGAALARALPSGICPLKIQNGKISRPD